MKKIIFLRTDATVVGGAERVMVNMANSFIKNNMEVTIVSIFKKNKKIYYPLDSKVKILYLNYNRDELGKKNFDKFKKYDFLKYSLLIMKQFLKIIKSLKSILKEQDYDYIIGMDTSNFLLPFLRIKTSKIIGTEHTSYLYWNKYIRKVKQIIYKKLDYFVVLNNFEFNFYKNKIKKIYKIENSIEITKKKSLLNNKRFITIGRLVEGKNIEEMIEILAEVLKKYNWELVICGEGPERKKIENKINELNIKENIILKGNVEDINTELEKSDIFLMTSKSEVFPMVILEAMNLGLPCISYDIPGVNEMIIHNETGYLVKTKQEYINSIQELINKSNKLKDFGEKSKKRSTKYNEKNIYKKWNILLNN